MKVHFRLRNITWELEFLRVRKMIAVFMTHEVLAVRQSFYIHKIYIWRNIYRAMYTERTWLILGIYNCFPQFSYKSWKTDDRQSEYFLRNTAKILFLYIFLHNIWLERYWCSGTILRMPWGIEKAGYVGQPKGYGCLWESQPEIGRYFRNELVILSLRGFLRRNKRQRTGCAAMPERRRVV